MYRRQPRHKNHIRLKVPRILRDTIRQIVKLGHGQRRGDAHPAELAEHTEDGQDRVRVEERIRQGALHHGGTAVGELDQPEGLHRDEAGEDVALRSWGSHLWDHG